MFGLGQKKYDSIMIEWQDAFDKGMGIFDTSKYYLDGNTVSFDNSDLFIYNVTRVSTYLNGKRIQVLTL
jgi:hypothetical protein